MAQEDVGASAARSVRLGDAAGAVLPELLQPEADGPHHGLRNRRGAGGALCRHPESALGLAADGRPLELGGTAAPATTANGESSATRTSSGAAGGAPAEVDGSGATSRSGVLLGGTDPLRRSLDGSAAAAAAAAAATLAPPPPLVSAIGSKDDRNQLSGGSAIAAAFLSGRL